MYYSKNSTWTTDEVELARFVKIQKRRKFKKKTPSPVKKFFKRLFKKR